jgi:hypothetical protein
MIPQEGFVMVYDLRDAETWQQAHRHRRLWGRRFADYFVLDEDHILMVFHSAGERWHPWEERRLRWIVGQGLEGKAA